MDFDHPDLLNDDGTVTLRFAPSNWRRYNVSPDTYQLFNGDSWCDSFIEYAREETGRDLTYDSFEWEYDHAGIVRGLAEVLCDWIVEKLGEHGLDVVSAEVRDSWSPQFYNFTSDGFEMDLTCDPAQLRALTEDFDVENWVREWYRSCDGFISYVPSRLEDSEWRAEYDGGFRIESLLAAADPRDDDDWRYAVWEQEWEVYDANTTVTEVAFLDTVHSLADWEKHARTLTNAQPEHLF